MNIPELIERLDSSVSDLKALPHGHVLYGRLVDEMTDAAQALRAQQEVVEAAMDEDCDCEYGDYGVKYNTCIACFANAKLDEL